jgi:hypothetical protein
MLFCVMICTRDINCHSNLFIHPQIYVYNNQAKVSCVAPFLLAMFNLTSVSILLIVIGILLFIGGLVLLICSVRYAHTLRPTSDSHGPVEPVRYPFAPSWKVRRKKDSSLPITNNAPSKRAEKKLDRTSSALQVTVPSGNDQFLSDTLFSDTGESRGDIDFLQLGAALIDRPFGTALQPLNGMGPVVMRMQINEQHWIRKDDA